MDIKEYRNRAQELLKQFDDICAAPSMHTNDYCYLDIEDWTREFRHLVYSYDRSLPLNKEIENANLFTIHYEDEFIERDKERVKKYVKFFIHYLETYCLKDEK